MSSTDWPITTLGKVTQLKSGNTPSKSRPELWGNHLPWVTARDLKTRHLSSASECLSEAGAELGKIAPPGSILVLVRGMTLHKDIPVCLSTSALAFNQDIKAFIVTESLHPEFLQYVILSQRNNILQHVESAGHGTGKLGTEFLRSIPVPVPDLGEQLQIVEVIQTWDEAIEKTNRLSVLIDKRKRVLQRTLVSFNEQRRVPLGSLVTAITRPVPKPNDPYRAMSIRSHGKGTFERIVRDPAKVTMDTLFQVKPGDLVVNITFAWEGAIALVEDGREGCLVSHRFPTYRIDQRRVDSQYLHHVVRSGRFVHWLGMVSPGGAGRNRVLNKKDFLKLPVPLPSLEEQRRIASVLECAEREIGTLETYLSNLENQKRGLMQKLLSGEWRLPVTRRSPCDA